MAHYMLCHVVVIAVRTAFLLLTSCCSASVVRCFEGWWSGTALQTSSSWRTPAGSSVEGGFWYWDLMASGTWVKTVIKQLEITKSLESGFLQLLIHARVELYSCSFLCCGRIHISYHFISVWWVMSGWVTAEFCPELSADSSFLFGQKITKTWLMHKNRLLTVCNHQAICTLTLSLPWWSSCCAGGRCAYWVHSVDGLYAGSPTWQHAGTSCPGTGRRADSGWTDWGSSDSAGH